MKSKYLLILIIVIFLSGCSDSSPEASSEPKTEIVANGIKTTMVIAPSKDNVISGIVTITAARMPSETGVMGFGIQGGDIPEDSSTSNIALLTDADDWSTSLDTTQYGNGNYEITIVAGSADFKSMLGSASVDVVIEN